MLTDRQTDRQTAVLTDRQTDRQTVVLTDRQTDRLTAVLLKSEVFLFIFSCIPVPAECS